MLWTYPSKAHACSWPSAACVRKRGLVGVWSPALRIAGSCFGESTGHPRLLGRPLPTCRGRPPRRSHRRLAHLAVTVLLPSGLRTPSANRIEIFRWLHPHDPPDRLPAHSRPLLTTRGRNISITSRAVWCRRRDPHRGLAHGSHPQALILRSVRRCFLAMLRIAAATQLHRPRLLGVRVLALL